MALSKLVPTAEPIDVQSTTLTLDAVGRYVCNTLDEAITNPCFDAIVIGSGMYGAYCAEKIYRLSSAKRVLILEAGSFLVSEHVQNLARIGLNVPGGILPADDPGVARNLVWGLPWRGDTEFPGLAYCVGGKSLFWGGWCPQLTAVDLQHWPAGAVAYLAAQYTTLESEIGVVPTSDFITGILNDAMRDELVHAAAVTPNIETVLGDSGVEEAPLAVQGSPPASGLFSFDKFSSAPLLLDAIREDADQAGLNDGARRLLLVPRAHVVKLHAANGVVDSIELYVNGEQRFLSVGTNCAVVLAASAIESTRLALHSFPTPLMGRNLMAHVRSDFTVRVRRAAFSPLPLDLETAAFLVRGLAASGRFHLQITASAHSEDSDALLFRMIPDLDLLSAQLANDDPDWIGVTIRGIGEMHGDTSTPIPNANGSWINLSPFEHDEFGVPRAYVQLRLSATDLQTWIAMDEAALALAQAVAGHPMNIEYLYDGGWQTVPHPLNRPFPPWHHGLGSTYHEAGTLWMGTSPASSVTDSFGRFHHVQNCYACDQSIFPTVGSVNPVLTGLTLARQLASHLAN